MKTKILIIINNIRLWLIKKLFTDDEKYLVILSVDDRIINLERIAVNERWADKDNIQADISDYKKLRWLFSTNLYN